MTTRRPVPRSALRTILALAATSSVAGGTLLFACGSDGSARVEEAAASVAAKNPFTEIERPRPGDERLRGSVTEVKPAGPYTYASIDVGGGRERWVVMLRAGGIARGDRVVVKSFGTQRAFRSRRLGMTFDELVFGVVRPDREGEGS